MDQALQLIHFRIEQEHIIMRRDNIIDYNYSYLEHRCLTTRTGETKCRGQIHHLAIGIPTQMLTLSWDDDVTREKLLQNGSISHLPTMYESHEHIL
jgi:hypothetical protein